jgi:hypothetical protein
MQRETGSGQALGITLFPNYPLIPDWYGAEVAGLTEAQLDFDSQEEEWMMWSIRRQVSHAAFVHFGWLLRRWAPLIFREGDVLPQIDLQKAERYDRRMDEESDWAIEHLLTRLREGVGMVLLILGRETVGEMRKKTVDRHAPPEERYRTAGDRAYDFWCHAARLNPDIRVDDQDPYHFRINLVGMIRQMYFECLLHLHTIQRLKRAQGLTPVVVIPREGYLTLPAFTGR